MLKFPSSNAAAGSLLLFGSAQFFFYMLVCEALSPGYSISSDVISDLGVGGTAQIFNSSAIIFGACIAASACALPPDGRSRLLNTLLFFAGLGAIGVGVFPETTGVPHYAGAFLAFFFGALSALWSAKGMKAPLSMFFYAFGIISLAALFLTVTHNYFGLGRGGMERMIVFPILFWAMAFAGGIFCEGKKKGAARGASAR